MKYSALDTDFLKDEFAMLTNGDLANIAKQVKKIENGESNRVDIKVASSVFTLQESYFLLKLWDEQNNKTNKRNM